MLEGRMFSAELRQTLKPYNRESACFLLLSARRSAVWVDVLSIRETDRRLPSIELHRPATDSECRCAYPHQLGFFRHPMAHKRHSTIRIRQRQPYLAVPQ